MLLYDFLVSDSEGAKEDLALVTWDDKASWSELSEASHLAVQWLKPLAKKRVGFQFCPSVGGFATLAALDFLECDAFLLDEQLTPEAANAVAAEFSFDAIVQGTKTAKPDDGKIDSNGADAKTLGPDAICPGVTILTSGTEGKPKAARHTWESLARPVRVSDSARGLTWMLAFRPHLYAGLQVILQCLANRGCLVVPRFRSEVDEIASMIVEHRVECVSATPSYWRRLVLFTEKDFWKKAAVRQITLGGEIVDQQILDALTARFPMARIVHIYATTELGRCFAVTDKRAGFPASLLDGETDDGIELRIEDGQLLAKSANSMQSYVAEKATKTASDGWWRTGDLIERAGDRVYFLGRAGDTINVGGNKVQPAQVEQIIRTVDGVANAQVYGVPSSITGQLVACRIVCKESSSEESVRELLPDAFEALSSFQKPRVLEFVDEIEIADSGKTVRSR